MPYGTIIFIALILAVACGLIYWVSALCADNSHPKRDRKALKSSFQLEMKDERDLHCKPSPMGSINRHVLYNDKRCKQS